MASTRVTTLTTSTPTSPRTLSSQASSGTSGLTWDRYSCLLDIYDYLRLIRFIPIFSLDLEILLKFFDGLSRQIFVRFRLISLGGWLGLISDLRCLDTRFTLSRDILFYYGKIFQYFVKTDQNQTNWSWLLCNFPTLTFSSEIFAIPGCLKTCKCSHALF